MGVGGIKKTPFRAGSVATIGSYRAEKPEVSMSEKKLNSEDKESTIGVCGGSDPIAYENNKRLINCVNAMAGIQDPKAFVEAAEKLADEVTCVVKGLKAGVRPIEMNKPAAIQYLREALEAFDVARKGVGNEKIKKG